MQTPWLETFVADCHQRLLRLPATDPAPQLLLTRGVTLQMLVGNKLGWLPDPHGITACTEEFWKWVVRYGWNKIVFPMHDALGRVIGVQLRSPVEKGYRDFVAVPPEICPPTFGLHVALPHAFRTKRLVLVEGVFDYVALAPYAPDTVAILTSSASLAVRRLINRYATTAVCLTDMDAAGRRGAHILAGLPIPPEFARPKDLTARPRKPPPFHVVFPSYSEHDPSDLLTAGKTSELQRLARVGLLSVQPLA